jgi:predicted enzyme related to lactoylglutathione lyase
MQSNGVVWFEIYVQDMERARAFYEGVLQVKMEKMMSGDIDMWRFPKDDGAMGINGTLVRVSGQPSGANSTLVYFSCRDCAVEEARAEKFGGRIHRGKLAIGAYGFVSLLVDTEGNMFGLHSMQ